VLGPIERGALQVLASELGWRKALMVGISIERALARGEPFQGLPAPDGAREEGSRALAGPAVVMYRALRERHPERALAVAARAVEEGTVVFLRMSAGSLRRAEVAALDDEGRKRFTEDRAARFPSAEIVWNTVSAERVSFTVTRCRLVELVRWAGHPELAPLFCAGDARHFGSVEPGIQLHRPTTLAEGAPSCPFTLEWDGPLGGQAR
jgi:hypothetical protein